MVDAAALGDHNRERAPRSMHLVRKTLHSQPSSPVGLVTPRDNLGPSTRAYRRVVAASHLLAITAYAMPWLRSLRRLPIAMQLGSALAVLALGVLFSVWTSRSRRPTLVSILGASTVAATIGVAPDALHVTGPHDVIGLLTPRTGITLAAAVGFGVVLARPAVWGCAYDRRPSLAAVERLGARSGLWLVLVASPPLVLAVWLFRAMPHDKEGLCGLVMAATILLFGVVVSVTGAVQVRRRTKWLAQVRRGEIPGFRIRPRIPSDPALVAFDDVASVRSSAVLEALARPSLFVEERGRPVALAPLQ